MRFSCSLSLSRSPSLSGSESPPAHLNIFSRTRRYSASSLSPLATSGLTASAAVAASASGGLSGAHNTSNTPGAASGAPRRLTPRVSQLRQEECADISNSREVNHERDLHSAIQISQSWEDLTIVTADWSCRDEASNPPNCSSPSPTSQRLQGSSTSSNSSSISVTNNNINNGGSQTVTTPGGLLCANTSIRYPSVSPSPTRRTFTTRRSMSPNNVRPSHLSGPAVKRKFDMDTDSNCSTSSTPPPHKKMFLESSRGSSPICPSPDSGTYEGGGGRTTPKIFLSKLCSSNSLSSFSSASASPTGQLLDSDSQQQQQQQPQTLLPFQRNPFALVLDKHLVSSAAGGGVLGKPDGVKSVNEGPEDELMAIEGEIQPDEEQLQKAVPAAQQQQQQRPCIKAKLRSHSKTAATSPPLPAGDDGVLMEEGDDNVDEREVDRLTAARDGGDLSNSSNGKKKRPEKVSMNVEPAERLEDEDSTMDNCSDDRNNSTQQTDNNGKGSIPLI